LFVGKRLKKYYGFDWIDLFLSICKTIYANKEDFYDIYNLVKVVYEKTTYEDTIFVSKNLTINVKTYLFA